MNTASHGIPPKPPAVHIDEDSMGAIPPKLLEARRWVVWKWTWKADKGKWDKPPIDPKGGHEIDQTDPANWMTFQQARRVAIRHGDGIGIALGPKDNRLGIVGIDLDDCIDADGNIGADARSTVDRFASYTERTPSGTGLRVLIWGDKPGPRCRTSRRPGIELYEADRYLTVTGRHLEGTPAQVCRRDEALAALYAEMFDEKSKPRAEGNGDSGGTDGELVERARRARNGAKFAALFDRGDVSGYAGDDSSADLALADMLAFWTGRDFNRIEALFGQSALGQRDKWRDRADYRQRTIDKAIDDCAEVYSPRPRAGTNGHARSGDHGQPGANGHAHTGGHGQPGADAPRADKEAMSYEALTDEELGLVRLGDVEMQPVRWLWDYRLARGEMALMAGEGGIGKSQILLAVAAAISKGREWPDKSGTAPPGQIVILSAEDSPEATIKPRLVAMDADIGRIVISKARVTMLRDGKRVVDPVSLQDLGYWRAFFDRLPETALFIVDPLPSYLGRGVNDQKNAEIRCVLEPFIEEILRPRGICLFGNTHLNKSVDIKTPVHRITGSIAYANIPRNVHLVVRDPERPDRRYFKQCKCNNAPDDLPALAFRVEKKILPHDGGQIEAAIPAFEDETVNVDLHSLLNGDGKRRGPKPVKTDALAVWLFDHLADQRRPVQAGPLHDAAAAAFAGEVPNPLGEKGDDGLWTNGRNLKRAADRIPFLEPPRNGKRIERFRDSETNRWYWQLINADSAF